MLNKYQEFIPKSWNSFKNYRKENLKRDLTAGITVGIVALPLAMAFAVASGVEPERGIFTAIIAGFLASLFGGTKVQIGGPTGAFVVVIYNIEQKHGYEGLAVATLMAGCFLVIMGLCRLGSLIKFVPYPLITGFTAGIAVIIFSAQIKDFFGLKIEFVPADFMEKWRIYIQNAASFDWITTAVAVATVLLIILVRKYVPRIPWGIVSIAVVGIVCWFFALPVDTIETRFGVIPRMLPKPTWSFHLSNWIDLIPAAVTIALLAGIESLLSAVIADSVTGGRHRPNSELIGQGIANLGSVIFGGIPATAAIARTATNIKTGARTPLAGMTHAATLFLIVLFLAPFVGQIPLASLAGMLVVVAWNMCELPKLVRLLKAPKADVLVLILTMLLTILTDITVAVEVGMVLAAFLFLRQMADERQAVFIKQQDLQSGIHIYEIKGPLFFGIAGRLKDLYYSNEPLPKILKLRMKHVPSMDATGIHALHDFHTHCCQQKTALVLTEVQPGLTKLLKEFGMGAMLDQ